MDKPLNVALSTIAHAGDFLQERALLHYNTFMPRLYNLCRWFGMERGKIMPSRAFCSDESQGLPIILITKHFGAFPFNHGRLGGVVATDRHGPYAEHGRDLVIIHATHVGYDSQTGRFGVYRRLQREDKKETSACGRIQAVVRRYLPEYQYAQDHIFVELRADRSIITLDNQFLDANRRDGLFPDLDYMLARHHDSGLRVLKSFSTTKSFLASAAFTQRLREAGWPEGERRPIGAALSCDLFRFRRVLPEGMDSQLERNLLSSMPHIVTAPVPLLAGAQASVQVEFDRAYRTITEEPGYRGRTLVYISGMNIDVSPEPGQSFPTTLFVPWAAYVQPRDGEPFILEQDELLARLMEQSPDNPDQISLEQVIQSMGEGDRLPSDITVPPPLP